MEQFLTIFENINKYAGLEINIFGLIVLGMDKVIHFFGMFFLSMILYIILKMFCKKQTNISILIFIILFILGMIKELMDLFIKQTYFSLGDIIANTIGIVCFLLFVNIFIKK